MPHESGTEYPGIGDKLGPWEEAAPWVWGAIQRASKQRTVIRETLGEVDDQLNGIDRKLDGLIVAKKAELGRVEELREDLRREREKREAVEKRLNDHLAAEKATEDAEDRQVRREGWRTVGLGAGGAGGTFAIIELVKALLERLAG